MSAFSRFTAFSAVLMTVFVLSAQDFPLADPAVRARITFRNVNTEELADGLRIRVKPNAKSNYGTFYLRLKVPDAPRYLQVTVGDIENAAAKPWVSNMSGGKNLPSGIGSLFSGVNTFSLEAFRGRSFSLGISQLGAGSSEGSWIDYHSIRITADPVGCVTANLKNGAEKLEVNGEMSVIFRPEQSLALPELSGTLFLLPSMTLYREFKLKQEPSGNYRADLRITKEDIALPASARAKMLVQVTLPETKAYYTIPFPIDIRTDRVIPAQVFQAATPEIRRLRSAWFEAVRGTNLALGKTVLFHPAPDMSLTKAGGSDAVDLTDGKLSGRSDDKLSFDPKAVGWFRKNRPEMIRGQLTMNFMKDPGGLPFPMRLAMSHCLVNVIGRPDFIAYGVDWGETLGFMICRSFHPMLAAWTITSQEQQETVRKRYHSVIFDHYIAQ